MSWQLPPHGRKYKLVATRKYPNDIELIMLIENDDNLIQRREYSWGNVHSLHDLELKKYLLSMSEGIEKGIYDIALIDEEIGQFPEDWC